MNEADGTSRVGGGAGSGASAASGQRVLMAPAPAVLLRARGRLIAFPRRPLVMGIVNVNDDSFSGDGTLDIDRALAQAGRMLAAGADVIDVGAESARTNRAAIPVAEEVARLRPFVRRFAGLVSSLGAGPVFDAGQLWPPLLSINAWRPEVIAAVLPDGGDLLNDIGGLPDDRNARVCAEHGCALLVMHSVGEPKVPHVHQRYPDVWEAIEGFFGRAIDAAVAAGVPREAIVLDPGIDFAKQRDDNLRIYRELGRLHRFGRPILLPVSRKTVIGDVLGLPDPTTRDAGTVACIAAGVLRGAQIFRVHHVEAAMRTIQTLQAVLEAEHEAGQEASFGDSGVSTREMPASQPESPPP